MKIMKIIKNYKLILLLLLCLIIILILIYLKDKKIDLFTLNLKLYGEDNTMATMDTMNNSNKLKIIELNHDISNLTNDTQTVINGGIIPSYTIKPITTKPFIPPLINAVDQEDITGLLKLNNSIIQTPNEFIIPFIQPEYVPITNAEARTACEQAFNDINNISTNCKNYSNSDTNTSFNINLEQCVSDLYENGAYQSYIINDSINVLTSQCYEDNII